MALSTQKVNNLWKLRVSGTFGNALNNLIIEFVLVIILFIVEMQLS